MRFAAQERTMGASERAAAPALECRLGPAPEEEAPAPGAMVAERSFRNLRRDNERLIWALLKARDRIRILEDAVADPSRRPIPTAPSAPSKGMRHRPSMREARS